MKQLTKEELASYSKARADYFDLKSQIAEITINQERLRRQKESALLNIELAFDALVKEQNSIEGKYGEGRVDLQTGEIHAINS
jgi:hypothetical protein